MESHQLPYQVDKCTKSYDEYKFTLPALYREVAKEELREDDAVREKALAEMRHWIAENPYIFKCRTDANSPFRWRVKRPLPDLYRKIAKEELREDDEIREQSLTQMREWIAKHPYIRKCRTDSSFLLRFLRFRKYSVPMVCETL
uniref:CRAL/TRIO N-terminal domain-containing protein n=1 Tax=Anopheles epiroticus TaxID=199890 RepID=A0A182PXA7_9DIPT